jgi:hypothetical protein
MSAELFGKREIHRYGTCAERVQKFMGRGKYTGAELMRNECGSFWREESKERGR